MIESLESRQLFAVTVTYVGESIIVTGTAAAETVTLKVEDTGTVIQVTIDNIVQPQTNPNTNETLIGLNVDMKGGNDVVHFTLNCGGNFNGTVHGGDGNDMIFYNAVYGTTDFILCGDANDDTIVTSGRGGGSLNGGNGSDTFDINFDTPGVTTYMEIAGSDPGMFGDRLKVNGVDRTATVDDPTRVGFNFNGVLDRDAAGNFTWDGEISASW